MNEEMTGQDKLEHGTPEWFELVGTLMSDAASRSSLAPDLTVSFVERYTDGTELSGGWVQGIRFDLVDGKPSYRVGVGLDEGADIVVEVTAAAARQLNLLRTNDARFAVVRDEILRSSDMRVEGDISRLGAWLESVHDPIVERTK
ncbi:hypothetical protein [Luteibacter sp. Lutesp34]|uniref:hypothetical protein n=1 Tax=Luteibacter sp. Lutesp34 TaxID=3243030 RepID=UPI0039B6A4CE